MVEVFLAIEIIVAIFLVSVILLQRSEGGALGMGGGGGAGGLMSARGAGDLLTRLTAILATAFIAVSLTLAVLTSQRDDGVSVFDDPENAAEDGGLPSLDDLELPANDLPALPDPGDDFGGEPADDTPDDAPDDTLGD